MIKGRKIKIEGILPRKDVYNITAPFEINGVDFILGREESGRHSEDSKIVWIKKVRGKNARWIWEVDRSMPSVAGEDPCITKITNELGVEEMVLGLVNVTWKDGVATNWKMRFYRGKDFAELKKVLAENIFFATGPDRMKDIRLVSLPNGKIGVFTRPQGGIYGLGKIAYIELNSLNDLSEKNILKAEVLPMPFKDEEWGGVNEIHVLENGNLGVLGHIAKAQKDNVLREKIKNYRAMEFIFDPRTKKVVKPKIIASADDFPKGKAKRPDLQKVIFSGGLVRKKDKTAVLYVGLRDKEAALIKIEDPFV